MAIQPLNFPPANLAQDQTPVPGEVGPSSFPYSTDNGLTYSYDKEKSSWVLKATDSVTMAKFELEMTYYLKKTGGLISGEESSLRFSKTANTVTPDRLVFKTNGELYMAGDHKKIIFQDVSGGTPTDIYIDAIAEDKKVIQFTSAGVNSLQRISFPSSHVGACLEHSAIPVEGEGKIIFDMNSGSSYLGSNVFQAGPESKVVFTAGYDIIFEIDNADGKVKVKPKNNNDKVFSVVQNNNTESGKQEGATVFAVDTDTHKLLATKDYDKGLRAGVDGAKVEGNESVVVFTEDNLLATVGFVRDGYFKPGMSVFTQYETEAEVGGMWTDNNNYYIRVE